MEFMIKLKLRYLDEIMLGLVCIIISNVIFIILNLILQFRPNIICIMSPEEIKGCRDLKLN